jgi:hypothetical protein
MYYIQFKYLAEGGFRSRYNLTGCGEGESAIPLNLAEVGGGEFSCGLSQHVFVNVYVLEAGKLVEVCEYSQKIECSEGYASVALAFCSPCQYYKCTSLVHLYLSI